MVVHSSRILTEDNARELAEWCEGRLVGEQDALNADMSQPGINVPCGEEVKRASLGDLIVHNDDGTFDVRKG